MGSTLHSLMVFTNASGIDKVSQAQEGFQFFGYDELSKLDPFTLKGIHALAKGATPKPYIPRKPRSYQENAINAVVSGFKDESRGQLILPCGAGKTLTALWIRERMKANKTLVLVPSLALLRQTKDVWKINEKNYFPFLSVCSEQDINDESKDSIIIHTYEVHGKVTTNPAAIRAFMKSHERWTIYSTYQSLSKIVTALENNEQTIDLVIADEAHKTAGSVKNNFALVHNNELLPARKRLYMTATPRVIGKIARDKLGTGHVKYLADMHDQSFFGKELFRMSFAEAINQGVLCDYKILAIGVNDQEMQETIRKRVYINDQSTTFDFANSYALSKAKVDPIV